VVRVEAEVGRMSSGEDMFDDDQEFACFGFSRKKSKSLEAKMMSIDEGCWSGSEGDDGHAGGGGGGVGSSLS
jgi:hypothetical protein